MEWLKNAYSYSPLEQELLKAEDLCSTLSQSPLAFDFDGITVRADAHKCHSTTNRTPPMVLIHGLGGSTESFAYLYPILLEYGDVFLIDLPGHGRNKDAHQYKKHVFHPDSSVELITKFIETVLPNKPFILVGHSYGTTHCLRVASGRLENNCCGVICIAPPYGKLVSSIQQLAVKYMPEFVFDALFRAKDRLGGLYSVSVNRQVSRKANEDVRRAQLRTNLRARTETILHTVSQARFFDVKVEHTIPVCPVLVVEAAEDQICPPKVAEKLYNSMKEAGKTNIELTKIFNAGHAIVFEKPAEVCAEIFKFLSQYGIIQSDPSYKSDTPFL